MTASPGARRYVAMKARQLMEDGLPRREAIKIAWAKARDKGYRT